MTAALFRECGGPEVLRLEQIPTPQPGAGEVLVEVKAVALNHLDLWVRRGLPADLMLPHIGGSDIAGLVAQLGPGVDGIEVGQRVLVNPTLFCGRCRQCAQGEESLCVYFKNLGEHINGGFAQFVAVPARNIYPLPARISFEDAACLPVSYQTAWRAIITKARVKPGEEVLVLGASGATAIAAIQVARTAGARVYAVTSGNRKLELVRGLGAERVYDRLELNFSTAVWADTGRRGVDVVIESVGSPTWEGSVRALAPGGRLITFGATAGAKVEMDLRRIFWRQIEVIGTTMASRGEFEAMLRVAWMGRFAPAIETVLPLSRIRDAHERLEAGDHFGKIVLKP
jgi:NADPH:quinone reductase-like Zn-dependent oxidoreductase